MRKSLLLCHWWIVLWTLAASAWAEDISFNRDIRPILSDKCYFCHGFDENNRQADLRLDDAESSLAVIEPGSPNDSELLRRITCDDDAERMPPPESHKERLSEEQVALVRRWIEQGARYEPHWAFVAPIRPAIDDETISDAIDHYVAAAHEVHGLSFAKPAAPNKWLRRVTLDLIGLPPMLAELDAFEKQVDAEGESSYEKAVDRLLASPHYGERMALEWMDVARYADTNGFQTDAYRMNWPWRDWAIRAFNTNMGYDQFTIEQLAGDLLDQPTQDQQVATAFNRNHTINGEGGAIAAENLAKNNFDRVETTATTWLGLTVGCCQCHDHKFDPLRQRDYYSLLSFFNQISETGTASKQFTAQVQGKPHAKVYWVDQPFIALASQSQQRSLDKLQDQLNAAKQRLVEVGDDYVPGFRKWVEEMRADPKLAETRLKGNYVQRFVNSAPLDDLTHDQTKGLADFYVSSNEPWATVKRAVHEAEASVASFQTEIPLVMVMRDDQPRDTFVLERGNYETPGEPVFPAVPGFLPPLSRSSTDPSKEPRANRLDLARWLVSPEHPLTARVTVNRYWQLVFGRGIVTTPDDFGLQGALPSHPELLDWLAVDFRESGWDVKRLLRGLVLSRTYRQSAEVSAAVVQADPENQWLARGTRQRLDARLLRDQALALSGLLTETIGGPPVAPYQPDGIWEAMSLEKNHYMQDSGDDLYRRSLYTVWRRVVAPANFFDVASRQGCSVRWQRTNTPLHALTTLNDPTYVEAARVWADRLSLLPDDDDLRLERVFFAATSRKLEADELASLRRSLHSARKHFAEQPGNAAELVATGEMNNKGHVNVSEHAAWASVCLLVLNLDETLSK